MAITLSDEAVPTDVQPEKACHDCPWRRNAARGWLGPSSKEEWIAIAHSDAEVPCHALEGPQCAGLAIYRANLCKVPRDPKVLRLPEDREAVFSAPQQFTDHHKIGKR
jgi:hypothetical protein